MEKPHVQIICSVVVLLGVAAFACSLAAEFKKLKARDMKVDGNLCYLPRSPAFGLGIAALVCLALAQIAGTTAAVAAMGDKKYKRNKVAHITLLVLSWITFGLATVLLATGSSMNNKQPYGRGWSEGKCYLIKDGVYAGSAVLVAMTVIFIIGLTSTTTTKRMHRHTCALQEA